MPETTPTGLVARISPVTKQIIYVSAESDAAAELDAPKHGGLVVSAVNPAEFASTNPNEWATSTTAPVTVDGTPVESPDDPAESGPGEHPDQSPDLPTRGASTDVWREYARTQGLPEDQVQAMGRDQLADHFTPTPSQED